MFLDSLGEALLIKDRVRRWYDHLKNIVLASVLPFIANLYQPHGPKQSVGGRRYIRIMKISRGKNLIISFLCLLTFALSNGTAKAYYGGLYGMGLYGGMYGGYGGLYGGLYGGMGGLYGGLYGGYGGLYGGLYGGGMYGGLYGGYGGLYGGYGGLYGGLYGGMYGLYGGMSPFGIQNMYQTIDTGTGLTYQVPFLQIAPLLGVAGLYNSLFPNLFNPSTPTASGEQAGLWQGLWSNNVYSGPMTMNLVADPITQALSGTAQLLTNYNLGVVVPVVGTALNGQVLVSGTGIGIGSQTFKLDVSGLLTSTTTMGGTYTIINLGSSAVVETGTINLALSTPVI